MNETLGIERLRSLAKFQVTKTQYLFAFTALFAILGLGLSSIPQSNDTVRQSKILSDVETPAASIIFTQRETLVYATRLAQWSNGGAPRRTVQIARNILAQRLAVIDTSGQSMGSRANNAYWSALKNSDAIVAAAPAGILPEKMHSEINKEVAPLIDEILAEARQLVVSYQRSVDSRMLKDAKATADRDRLNLIFFYIFITTSALFLFLNVRTNFKNYRLARLALDADQKKLEETIEELRQTQSTVVELRDLNEAKNAFISTVNHELRTPLTSIIGYIDVIREEKLDSDNPELDMYLDVLDRNAQILLNLVESMLSISRIDSAEGRLPEDQVSLNEVIDNAIFVMKPASEKSDITIRFTSDQERLVQGDVGQLNQVFINLLANAVKFSPSGSTIDVKLDARLDPEGARYARVTITDHGIGIPKDDISRLFTRFFRAKNADSGQYPGTGLGLAIVQQVVNRHHGLIRVESEVGIGSTFTVEIPLHLTEEDQLIESRKYEVLGRAIAAIDEATPETIKEVAHQHGGALGFYGFESQGRALLDYSRHSGQERPRDQFESVKLELLNLLKKSGENNG